MKGRQELHRELWIRVYAAYMSKDGYRTTEEATQYANVAVKDFDKRFNEPWDVDRAYDLP